MKFYYDFPQVFDIFFLHTMLHNGGIFTINDKREFFLELSKKLIRPGSI